MSALIRIIDDYRDAHGQPSEASVARAIGASPQAVSNWRKRGLKELPDKETLRRLADFVGLPMEDVLMAAAYDAGYIDEEPGPAVGGSTVQPNTRVRKYA